MRRMNRLLRRTALPLGFAVAFIALLLMVSPASAQEPTAAESGTSLHPGVNLIGWVGEPMPVAQLFREIPQLEAVWVWDAELDEWVVAGRDAPEWLGGLRQVKAGMGLRMQLSGDAPVIWDRSTEPTRGLVKLRTGWNLVAWSGADGASIDDVVKGIGWSLRSVRRWDAATQQWATWTSPERSAQVIADTNGGEEAESPGVRRGEALWVNVSRSVNWLQPTDILPRLVFPGGASEELQARVREDLEAVLSYFKDQYGIQMDPGTTILVPKDVESLLQSDDYDGDSARTRAQWNLTGGWAGDPIVLKQDFWGRVPGRAENATGRYTLTHEYFHNLQSELRDGYAPTWLVEGTAEWAETEHRVIDGSATWHDVRKVTQSIMITAGPSPTLPSTELGNGVWQYTLGWLATDLLTADIEPDSWIEFWRRMTSTEIGPHGRWASSLDWRTAFEEVFGMPVADFYVRFASWQREQVQRNAATPTYSDGDAHWIRGRVTGEGGAPVASVFVNAVRVEGETKVGWDRRAETDDDGAFSVRVFGEGEYDLSVDIDDCTVFYYFPDQLNLVRDVIQSVEVAQSDVRGVEIRLPPNTCDRSQHRIHGRVIGPNAEPLANLWVGASTYFWNPAVWQRTASDGSFSAIVSRGDEYYLQIHLADGCSVLFAEGDGIATRPDDAISIRVVDSDIDGVLVQVPAEACIQQIRGHVQDSNGAGLRNISRVSAWLGDAEYTDLEPASDGEFVITVPVDGAYSLSVTAEDCRIMYYSRDGLTTNRAEAWLFNVNGRHVETLPRQAPPGACVEQSDDAVEEVEETTTVEAWENTATLKIAATQLADGRLELGVELENGERLLPSERFFPTDAVVGQWWASSDVEVGGVAVGRISARLETASRIELGFLAADGERRLPTGRFTPRSWSVGRWLSSTEFEVPWPE